MRSTSGTSIILLLLLFLLPSCTTTLNHGIALDRGKSDLSFRSPLMPAGNSLDIRYGLTDEITLGASARGLVFPGGEVYGIYGIKTDAIDAAVSAGILIDPTGYDHRGTNTSFGPWVSPTVSIAVSKEVGAFRPYAGVYGDYWKGSIEVGAEWKLGQLKLLLGAGGSSYFHDYGPVDYEGPGIIVAHKRGFQHLSVIPGVSWEF